jgi:hypothetical protein
MEVSMKIRRITIGVILALALALANITNAIAVPPIANSFYGTVKVNGANIPAGTSVTAWCLSVQYASSAYMTYNGDTVYALNVPGDDLSTTGVVEGCTSGQTITFKIGQLVANQTWSWSAGSNIQLNLTATGLPSQSLSLVAGWNLVSFRLHPMDTSITSVLSSLGDQYSLVYAWDAANGKWLIYDPTLGALNDLNTLDETMGFWIKMKSAQTLTVSGSVTASTSISLKAGWNLVGYPSAVNGPLAAVLTDHGVGTDFSLVYAYHANEGSAAWKLFDRSGNPLLNDLTELSPGWGYWVKASAARTWTVP